MNVPKTTPIVSNIGRATGTLYFDAILSKNRQAKPAKIAAIHAPGISVIMPSIFRNAAGIIDATAPSGNTEYQNPSNGTNSFSHDGGFSVKAILPPSKLPATRNV